MKFDPILTKAIHLAKKKNYNEAIKILEAEAGRYYGSFTYYYILGICYLYSNIFGVALTFMKLAMEQKLRDPNTLLGMAALYLNHGDTDKAVDLYLEVQTIDETNRIAKKALGVIRKYPGPENISTWIDSGKLRTLYPPFPQAALPFKTLLFRAGLGMAALIIIFGITLRTGVISLPASASLRELPVEIELAREEMDAPVQTGGSYRYVLTRSQVLDEYNDARRLFTEYRDEAAKVKLNRLLESNASEPIKNRARLLISYMTVPGFDTFRTFREEDKFTYSDVLKEPFIYRDCHVVWRGMATNLNLQMNHTSFDFLIGYDTYRVMEGIVQVEFNFAVPVNTERPVEILGRIIPFSTERESGFRIQGVALNQAGLLDQNSARN